jgi:hypothetical protein
MVVAKMRIHGTLRTIRYASEEICLGRDSPFSG